METIQNEKSELQRKAALMEGPFFYPLQCIWKKTRKLVFSTANGELAFEQKGKVRIVAGDPRATTLDKAVLVFKEFVKDSHAQGFAVCGYYFSEGFALESGHFAHKCGVSRFENLRQWSLNGPQSEEARRALRKAKEAKLSIERLEPTDLKQNLEALSLADQKWQKSKGWVRIRFLLSRFQATLEEVSRGSEV
ncbi:MAG: phosphatidylglycerol lysyltransferase domain-containing protein, partial [Pseudomonadota bacterium]